VTVIILGGAANLERQLCTAFNPATGEVDFSPLSAQIVAGTPYRLTGLMSPEVSVAGLAADLAVPLPDSTDDLLMRDVVGNKTDTPVTTVGTTKSLMAYIKGIISGAAGTGKIYFGITVAPAGSLTINNDVLCIGDIVVGAGGTLVINGEVHCTGNITNTTGSITILGDVYCGWTFSNTTGRVQLYGNFYQGEINQNDPTSNGDFTLYGNFDGSDIQTFGADGFTINGNVIAQSININAPAGNLGVNGNVEANIFNANQDGIDIDILGDFTVFQSFTLGNGVSGSMTVLGHLYCSGGYTVNAGATLTTGAQEVTGDINVGDGGTLIINGDCQVTGVFNAGADGINVTVNGDCSVAGAFYLGGGASGTMTVSGSMTVSGDATIAVGASLTAGPLTVNGNITNAGTITSNGGILYAGTYTNTGTVVNKMYKSP